jgi:hypothetical protein
MTTEKDDDGEVPQNSNVVQLDDFRDREERSGNSMYLATVEESSFDRRAIGIVENKGVYLLMCPAEKEGFLLSPKLARFLGVYLIEAAAVWAYNYEDDITRMEREDGEEYEDDHESSEPGDLPEEDP